MSFQIEQAGERLQVRITGIAGNEQQVLDVVNACKGQSWWSCPSGECAKIGSCDAREDQGVIWLTLAPRTGESFSVAGLTECLRYVLDEAAAGRKS